MVKVVVIIQTRTGSSRFPGKVLKEFVGKPSIIHIIERVSRMKTIDEIVIATTKLKEDDVLVKTVKNQDIKVYRGETQDVLDRYYQAAKETNADVVIRITSDNPLIDPVVSDKVVNTFFDKKCDYCCNNMPRTYPVGLDTECFTFGSLKSAWKNAKSKYEREHVTIFIRENKDEFKIINVENEKNLSNLRWTMDYAEDYEFMKSVYESLFSNNPNFSMFDVLDLLDKKPQIGTLNKIYSDENP